MKILGRGTKVKRILLIRSAPIGQTRTTIELLKSNFPEAKITLFVQPEVSKIFTKDVSEIILYEDKPFKFYRFKGLNRIRRACFDLVVVLYNNPKGVGYLHVELLSFFVRAKYRIIYDTMLNNHPLTLRSWLRRILFNNQLAINWSYSLIPKWNTCLIFLFLGMAYLKEGLKPFISSKSKRGNKKGYRVLYMIPYLDIGGTQSQLIKTLQYIDKERYEIEVACLRGGMYVERIKRMGVRVTILNENPDFPNILKIYSYIKRGRFDMVHLWLIQVHVVGAICARLAGVPIIISSIRCENSKDVNLRCWFRLADILSVRFNTKIIACCEAVKRDYMKWAKINGGKISVIHNAIDLDDFNIYVDIPSKRKEFRLKENPLIGLIARLSLEKDHLTFLEAASMVIKSIPESRFLVVGEGELMEELKSTAQRMNLFQNVIFTGVRADIREIISILTTVVLPSVSEGLPNVILEAYACKKPVVATRVGGIPELVIDNHTGILVEPRNPADLSSAIIKILKNKDLARMFGTAGYNIVKESFTFRKNIGMLEKLYKEVLV
ncbi:MAG: glycosyltransferase [bacterium]|nr:glycosyltransferase [bacterium]